VSKPASALEFATYLETNFNWRIKEISDLKKAISEANKAYRPVLRKAAIPILYAHWEGHARFVVEAYLKYVARRKINLKNLSLHMRGIALHDFFKKNFSAIPNYDKRADILKEIIESSEKQFRSFPDDCVNTGSNLNFERTSQIARMLGFDFPFEPFDIDTLDRKLLEARNIIAHSAIKIVDEDDLERLFDSVISMMRAFRDVVTNLVVEEKFKRS